MTGVETDGNLADIINRAMRTTIDCELARMGAPAEGEAPNIAVTKLGYQVQISTDMAMDYGLLPDTRPPRPLPSRWQRLRWAWQDKRQSARMRLASWIAGFDVDG